VVIWGTVLVIDDSGVYRQLMGTLLAPYCQSVLTAARAREGIEKIKRDPTIELVLCDYLMKGGDGIEVLEAIHEMPEPKPLVLMVTGYVSEQNEARARELGAGDYLTKPTTIRKIIRALDKGGSGERRAMNPRWRCAGKAHLLDGGNDHVIWDVYNISDDGAFLETKGPIPVGSELELLLEIGGRKTEARARVARIQEPTWMDVGGVGVEFLEISQQTEDAIRAAIEHGALED
jgi:CheY-like chemotaxis protein